MQSANMIQWNLKWSTAIIEDLHWFSEMAHLCCLWSFDIFQSLPEKTVSDISKNQSLIVKFSLKYLLPLIWGWKSVFIYKNCIFCCLLKWLNYFHDWLEKYVNVLQLFLQFGNTTSQSAKDCSELHIRIFKKWEVIHTFQVF